MDPGKVFRKGVEVLLALEYLQTYEPAHCYVEKLCKHVSLTRSHTQACVKLFVDSGLIAVKESDKKKFLSLTKEGRRFTDGLRQFYPTRKMAARVVADIEDGDHGRGYP